MGIDIHKSATVNASADRLWEILGDDFEKVSDWASGVDSSGANVEVPVLDGATIGGRVCEAPGFGAIHETLTTFEPEQRSFAFVATASKIPSFVRNITNHTSVRPLGPDRAELQVRITADTDGLRGALVKPLMVRKFGKGIDSLIEDVSVFAESGKVSDKKTEALAKSGH